MGPSSPVGLGMSIRSRASWTITASSWTAVTFLRSVTTRLLPECRRDVGREHAQLVEQIRDVAVDELHLVMGHAGVHVRLELRANLARRTNEAGFLDRLGGRVLREALREDRERLSRLVPGILVRRANADVD